MTRTEVNFRNKRRHFSQKQMKLSYRNERSCVALEPGMPSARGPLYHRGTWTVMPRVYLVANTLGPLPGPELEVDFRYTNFFWHPPPPRGVWYQPATKQRPGTSATQQQPKGMKTHTANLCLHVPLPRNSTRPHMTWESAPWQLSVARHRCTIPRCTHPNSPQNHRKPELQAQDLSSEVSFMGANNSRGFGVVSVLSWRPLDGCNHHREGPQT